MEPEPERTCRLKLLYQSISKPLIVKLYGQRTQLFLNAKHNKILEAACYCNCEFCPPLQTRLHLLNFKRSVIKYSFMSLL